MFKHKTDLNIPEIKAKTTDGVRLYETPEGKFYPSITTVLKNRDKQGLHEWRERVGEDVANYVARKSATRGTQVHHFCEKYLDNGYENKDWYDYKKGRFLSYCLFSQLKPYLDECIGLVHCQEQTLWHNFYKIAGRVDCIAEWDEFYLSLILKQVQKNEKIVGMKTITYRPLHMQRCIKKEHYKR